MHHGCLYDLLHNGTMVLEGDVIMQFIRDITSGVRFLHCATPQLIHGDIKSMNILVDNKFHAKVTDFGLSNKNRHGTGTPYWMAPELLRGESPNTAATDCFSLGIVIWEVFARRDPYEDDRDSFEEVLIQIANPSIRKRPIVPRTMPEAIKALMTDCLEDDPSKRPTMEEIDTRLKRIDAEAATMAQPGFRDTTQVSLFDIFPKHVAQALQEGRTVEPEHKDCVTIFFSDIVGKSSPPTQLAWRPRPNLLAC
jgi:serine/threonine protein kinase